MSAFDVAIASKHGQSILDLMKPHEGEWIWFDIGGRGWEPYAYIDIDESWHSQYVFNHDDDSGGFPMDINSWRTELWRWIGNLPHDYTITMVRCKG